MQELVAFQTLLESHIDFFELWSSRNMFVFPNHLPIVAGAGPSRRGRGG